MADPSHGAQDAAAPLTLDALLARATAHEPLPPLALYLSLRGRIDRRRFWLHGVLALLLAGLVGIALLQIAGVQAEDAREVVDVLLVWPMVAVSVKRWHDIDRSGWFVLVSLIPGVGQLIALVANGFLRGTAGTNRHGAPSPEALAG